MKTQIIYATVEGQTGKIAEFAAKKVRDLGHDVEIFDAEEPTTISFEGVDAVILAASVHQRRHPRNFEALLVAHKDELAARKTLMLSVSLNAAFPEGQEEANEYLEEMKMRTGLEPDKEALIAGAVRISEYDYFALQVVRHVVLRSRKVDLTKSTHEFTDWDGLSQNIESFLEDAAA